MLTNRLSVSAICDTSLSVKTRMAKRTAMMIKLTKPWKTKVYKYCHQTVPAEILGLAHGDTQTQILDDKERM